MAQTNAAAKVGTVVIIAGLLLGAVVYFFVGRGAGGYPVIVTFADAQGIKQQADVRLSGVKIGTVQDITVDPAGGHAVVSMRIYKDKRIPEGSTYTITSGGLLGEMFVQIKAPAIASGRFIAANGRPPVIRGTDLPTFDDLKSQVAALTSGSQDILRDTKRVTSAVARLANDPDIQNSLRHSVQNVDAISSNASAVSADTRRTVARLAVAVDEEIPGLRAALHRLEDATRDAKPITQDTRRLLREASGLKTKLTETLDFIQQTVQGLIEDTGLKPSLKDTMVNLRDASERLKAIADDARKISSDLAAKGEAQSKVGETVLAVRDAAQKANTLLDKLNTVASKASKGRVQMPQTGASLEARQRFSGTEPFSADASLALLGGSGGGTLLGLQDIGDGNRLRLLKVVSLGPNLHYSYGLEHSELGAGVDYLFHGATAFPGVADAPGTTGLSANISDPNNLRLDLRVRKQISPKLGVFVGMEDAFHRARPAMGLSYRP